MATQTTLEDVKNNNVLVFANYYVQLVNGDGETKNINTVKGGYNPSNQAHALCLQIVKNDPSRLLSRPTLSTGEKLYASDPSTQFNITEWA